jgi:type VI secretion system protein VasD
MKSMNNKRIIVTIFLALGVSGCGTVVEVVKKTSQIVMDPSVPVGEPEDTPSEMLLSLHAREDVNPNIFTDNPGVSIFITGQDKDAIEDEVEDLLLAIESDATEIEQDIQRLENIEPESTPISFKVIYLKDDSLLLSSDYESLVKSLEDTLGKTYLDHDDYQLLPGQFKLVEYTAVPEETKYIGVIAAYKNYNNAKWKSVLKVEPTGNKYPVLVEFKTSEITIKLEN